MSLKNKLRFSAMASVLITPVIALPLVNAVMPTTDKNITNYADKVIAITEKSNFTVRFEKNDKWGEYASIYKMHIDDKDEIENLEIPDEVETEGFHFYVRTLNCTQNRSGKGTIRCLDLSKAKHLVDICDTCFITGQFKINWVNFKGASSLETIGSGAFGHQYFDSTINIDHGIWDFTGTKLRYIGKNAFLSACADNKNKFTAVIFPTTLKQIDNSAFHSDNHDYCRMYFGKVVFTNPNPTNELFGNKDSFPRSIDKKENSVIVPHGCADKYKNLSNFDRAYSNCVYDSTLYYKADKMGYLRMTHLQYQGGLDNSGDWIPYSGTERQKKTYLWLSNTYDTHLSLDEFGQLNWTNSLAPGEYKTTVYGVVYDDYKGTKLSVIASEEITISVINPKLTGGSTYITVPEKTKCEDTKYGKETWSVDVGTEGKPHPVSTVEKWSIINKPSALEEVSLEEITQTNKAKWYWGTGLTTKGTYTFTICAEVKDNWAQNTYKVYQNIIFCVGNYGSITVKQHNGTEYVDYNGEEIKLSQDGTKTAEFQLTITATGTPTIETPELSIDGITVSGPGTSGEYTFTFDSANLNPGLYTFNAHSKVTIDGVEYDFYSPTSIKISVDQDTRELGELPEEIDVVKTKAGSASYKLIKTGNEEITNVVAKPAIWHSQDERVGKDIYFKVDPDDNKSLYVQWIEIYSPLGNPFDVLDVQLDITLKEPETNAEKTVHHVVSVVATNESEITFDDKTSKIEVHPEQDVVIDKPFTFKLNGESSGYDNIIWGCACADPDDNLNQCISMVQPNAGQGDTACLKCELKTKGSQIVVKEGLHEVIVYAVDDDNITAAYITVNLYVGYTVTILDAPETIEAVAGASGKTQQPLITLLSGETASNPIYRIEGLGDSVEVDQEGYICWKGDIPLGPHLVTLTSTVKVGSKSYSTSTHFTINVSPAPKNNTGAIVGGTVGGTVAAGGAATGITLGVRKHKFAKGKKK